MSSLNDYNDLVHSWNSSLSIALGENGPISGVDAYSIFGEAFDDNISVELLRSMSDADYDRLLKCARTFLEIPTIAMAVIRQAVADTIWHHSDDSGAKDDES